MRWGLTSYAQDRDGTSTVEFVLLFPTFLMAFLWSFETGLILLRHTVLEKSVDEAMREIRVDSSLFPANSTEAERHDIIKSLICDGTSLLPDCSDNIRLNLEEFADSASFTTRDIECIDRLDDVDPVIAFNTGGGTTAGSTTVMYVRACLIIDPILPSAFAMPITLDESHGFALVSDSAFVNEPG